MTAIYVPVEDLQAIHSALDDALGDTDVTHIEDDDELREREPVQWAAQEIARILRIDEETEAHPTPEQDFGSLD